MTIIFKDHEEHYQRDSEHFLKRRSFRKAPEKDRYTMYIYVSRYGKISSITVDKYIGGQGIGFLGPIEWDKFWYRFDRYSRHYLKKGFKPVHQNLSIFDL